MNNCQAKNRKKFGKPLPYTPDQHTSLDKLSDGLEMARNVVQRLHCFIESHLIQGTAAINPELSARALVHLLKDFYVSLRRPVTQLLHFRMGPVSHMLDAPIALFGIDGHFTKADHAVVLRYVLYGLRRCAKSGTRTVGVCFDGSTMSTWAREANLCMDRPPDPRTLLGSMRECTEHANGIMREKKRHMGVLHKSGKLCVADNIILKDHLAEMICAIIPHDRRTPLVQGEATFRGTAAHRKGRYSALGKEYPSDGKALSDLLTSSYGWPLVGRMAQQELLMWRVQRSVHKKAVSVSLLVELYGQVLFDCRRIELMSTGQVNFNLFVYQPWPDRPMDGIDPLELFAGWEDEIHKLKRFIVQVNNQKDHEPDGPFAEQMLVSKARILAACGGGCEAMSDGSLVPIGMGFEGAELIRCVCVAFG
jgi:hypothetical protein